MRWNFKSAVAKHFPFIFETLLVLVHLVSYILIHREFKYLASSNIFGGSPFDKPKIGFLNVLFLFVVLYLLVKNFHIVREGAVFFFVLYMYRDFT